MELDINKMLRLGRKTHTKEMNRFLNGNIYDNDKEATINMLKNKLASDIKNGILDFETLFLQAIELIDFLSADGLSMLDTIKEYIQFAKDKKENAVMQQYFTVSTENELLFHELPFN